MSAVVNVVQASEILGCCSKGGFNSLKNRADFPSPINPEVCRGYLWKRADIIRFNCDLKKGAIDPLVSSMSHAFLTGKFAPDADKLQAMSKHTLARINQHTSTTVHVNGEWSI